MGDATAQESHEVTRYQTRSPRLRPCPSARESTPSYAALRRLTARDRWWWRGCGLWRNKVRLYQKRQLLLREEVDLDHKRRHQQQHQLQPTPCDKVHSWHQQVLRWRSTRAQDAHKPQNPHLMTLLPPPAQRHVGLAAWMPLQSKQDILQHGREMLSGRAPSNDTSHTVRTRRKCAFLSSSVGSFTP